MKRRLNNERDIIKSPTKKRRFIKDAISLTVIAFLLRGSSTAFSIYISNIIGAEGIGLFQLTLSIYFLFVTFATSGISLAVTKIVSEQIALENTIAVRSTFRRCISLSVTLSIIAGIVLFSYAQPIGLVILKDGRTITSLKLLSIGLPALSISATIRGYFLGLKKGVKAASDDIVEQVAQIVITIPIILAVAPKGIEVACCGLIIGATIAEIISCIYTIVLYRLEKLKLKGRIEKGITKQIFSIVVPVAISSYIRSLLTSLENILMPSGLKKYGQTSGEALSQYGIIKGMTLPLLYFPSAILSAFASLLIPEVSAAAALNRKKRIDYIVNKSIKVTLIFAFLITGLFFSFANEISLTFYKNVKVGTMLAIFAPLIPLMYLDQIVDSILKGLNQQLSSMKYNTVDSALRATIIYFLVPIMGIKGYVIMLYVGTIFNALLSINRLIVVSKIRFHLVRWVVLPCIAIIVSCLFAEFMLQTNVVFGMILVSVCYFFILFFLGCITKRDIAWAIQVFYKK